MASALRQLARVAPVGTCQRRVESGDERDPKMQSLFVVQGKNDPRVPYTESLQMVDTTKKNGGPVWFLMASDEGHGWSRSFASTC